MAKLLTDWQPENPSQWAQSGRSIARRNLWISVPSLMLAFVVWQVWSVVVVKLPQVGFEFTKNQLFWLAAMPALSGATMRIFYSFMVPIFGGRRFTAVSTASLLIPAIGLGICVQNPNTSYALMLVLALLCGFGGANFSSSMANISFFYPKAEKGNALGINAGLGNLGVSVVQFVVPLVITAGVFGAFGGEPQVLKNADGSTGSIWLQNAGFVWVPFIAICAIAAWFGMNDISSAKASFKEQAVIFKRKHNWLMCWLYIGTFGSFIGFSAAFPLLTKSEFPMVDPTKYAFLGPFVGALSRVVGGWVSDRVPAGKVTQYSFIIMILAVCGVIFFLPHNGMGGNFWGFFSCFMLLFAFTGVGNASTFAQAPRIFSALTELRLKNASEDMLYQARNDAARESAAVVGFMGAIGAYGGFFIPKSFGTSLAVTGSPVAALVGFIVFYITCVLINWWYYARKNAEIEC
ncbi:NarK family nitrate/nitrite MFS transporter [Stenoxybacter acetivorans]|uniref:NarK family nitrate/nitrite MFS transporter n=1 Tax=Stenoxybacter acetivorans TaxID=422441 RepID=UPI00056BC687|nr:NarK family nitrate/nitrite MFS transporter [Stenoxybacter acetivorans]